MFTFYFTCTQIQGLWNSLQDFPCSRKFLSTQVEHCFYLYFHTDLSMSSVNLSQRQMLWKYLDQTSVVSYRHETPQCCQQSCLIQLWYAEVENAAISHIEKSVSIAISRYQQFFATSQASAGPFECSFNCTLLQFSSHAFPVISGSPKRWSTSFDKI